MECRGCKSPLPEGTRYCPHCGTSVGTDEMDSPTELTPSGPGDTTIDRGADSRGGSDRRTKEPSSPSPSRSPTRLGRLASDSGEPDRFEFGEILAERYRILGRIGGGGMGDVYRADDLTLGQAVALKFLPESLTADPDRLGRLFAEVRLARQVSHRNVCRVYDIVEHNGQSFLSMEFIDGEDLGSLLRRAGRLAPEKATEIARQICAGLHAAHEKGILHRDLKPANIFVDSDGVAHIGDFGLAGIEEEIAGHEIRAGTPNYMSPEQIQGREVTVQSDVYALGLLLYEMYTGRRALAGKSIGEIEDRRSQLVTQTSTELSALDPAVERAISRCLEPDAAMRPPNALAVAAALPGGDPLAAALAAGELPSPEMIAASGSAGTLALPIGIAALILVVVGFAVQIGSAPRSLMQELVGLPKSSAVLEERGRELRRDLGYPDSLAVDQAEGWWQDRSALNYERRIHPENPRWDSLSVGQPSPISFWFRESPSHLVPRSLIGSVSPADPARTTAHMVTMTLNPRGDLQWFQAVPPGRPAEPASMGELSEADGADQGPGAEEEIVSEAAPVRIASLDALFLEAALDPADFEPIPRNWTPPNYADEVHTFRGRYRDRPSYEIEVRIAGYEGRPTLFDIIEPWELDSIEEGGRSGSDWTQIILQGMVIFLIVSAALLARRNVRLGQGDRRGAARLATAAILAMSGALLLSANHVPIFQSEWNMINVNVGLGLVLGALTWFIYIALEPFARRFWPETLISWSRLLQGRIDDPRVGRDLLLGVAVGSVLGTFAPLRVVLFPEIGQAPVLPGICNVSFLGGFLNYLSTMLLLPLNSVWIPMAILLLAIGIRSVVRNKKAAIVINTLFFFVVLALGATGPIDIALIAVGVVLFVGTLFRLGLLAMMALYLTTEIHGQLPFTSDFGAWYAWPSIVTMLGLFALALHGFRLSRRQLDTGAGV